MSEHCVKVGATVPI